MGKKSSSGSIVGVVFSGPSIILYWILGRRKFRDGRTGSHLVCFSAKESREDCRKVEISQQCFGVLEKKSCSGCLSDYNKRQ